MELTIRTYELPLAHPFTISRGTQTVQPTLVVELTDAKGRSGYGEATTNSYYGATLENMTEALEAVRPAVEAWSGDDPPELWRELDGLLSANRFAQCALDMAAWDLFARRKDQPLWQLWGLETRDLPPTSYTIGLDTIDQMIAKLEERPDWPVYKIKLGGKNDLEIVQALRACTASPFRVDANCGWSRERALEVCEPLAGLGVELIEQPLSPDDQKAYGAGREKGEQHAGPWWVADESCVTEADVEPCARAGFDGVNIKLVKCGGLTPARRMIAHARLLGLKVMIGCMTESSVGISAAAQLLPLVDYADLDGALLLSQDIASGVTFPRGACEFVAAAGTGVSLL